MEDKSCSENNGVVEDSYNDKLELKKPTFKEKLKSKKGIFSVIGGILIFLSKFKFVLTLILVKLKFIIILFSKLKILFIALKLGKFFTTFISMFLMVFVYAKLYGLLFGIGFVILLFAHEMGHYIMAKYTNVNVSAPIFIPFVGALVKLNEQPKDAVTEAKLAIGGPILGSIAAILCFFLYTITGKEYYLAICYTGFMLNLFNLIPIHPLDGGRVVTAISPKIWFLGIPLMILAMIKFFNPIILIILIHGITQAYKYYKEKNEKYYNTDSLTKIIFTAAYFGLVITLGVGMVYIRGIYGDI